MRYQTKPGDSPTRIARAYGVSRDTLLRANPHKPTKVVAGQRTWQSLVPRETINVPVGGMVGDSFVGVGDPAADVVNILMAGGGPCIQANVNYVCQIQSILGVTVDGKYGSVTAAALRALVPNAPPGCSPTPAWWAPKGSNKCSGAAPPPPVPTPVAPRPSAGFIDPCDPTNVSAVCAMQRAAGLTVDGKYGPNTAAAARRSDPNAPGPCSPTPAWWAPKGSSKCPGATPPPGPVPTPTILPSPVPQPVYVPDPVVPTPQPSAVVVPAAVAALASIDPCAQSSLEVVYAAQRALGVSPDGKYGNDTATAARRYLPNAPAGCSPRPGWWAPKGQSNTPNGGSVPTPPPRPPEPGPTVVVPVPPPAPPPGPGGQPIVVGPEPAKKLSTGAIVAGAIGALALVGVVAVAVTGKRGARGSRGKRGSRGPARRKSSSRKKR